MKPLKEKIRVLAVNDERSLSQYINLILKSHINNKTLDSDK